ncbi:pyruvate dehydrogenase E2 component (dihydrolipoamide acetyltransferase) [Prosthecobacter fusiformis]|uniref:Acetyltransferase component of pyruvate dehydrogenase complex n=1 Tax=Prosthecobacter fusiformis TaxID=48464 RepID=A0A4R7RZN9_9BACT|nr:pyruvate dehydrogenase complex dihydrolipoamide acetyltransferase [Prosthecobacter fusiformis]TDU70568.1 pyruvate dehydrogenase E2 component (dihydrolipoamide acetyltransferase) [Prosthecobacter fusiformis]
MPKIIEMPKLSDTMTEGTLAKWTVKEGDKVTTGQTIADVETDKATMEYASPFEGTVLKLIIEPGLKVPLNSPIAVILEEDEEAPANLDELIAKAKAASAPAPKPEKPAAGSGAKKAVSAPGPRLPSAPQPTRRAAAGNARVKASPLAKKIADERGVDLTTLDGSGPGGRIVRADVENAPVGGASGGSRVAATPAIRPTYGPEDERVATSSMRNIIAERLLASKTQIPHFYLQMEVDAGPLMEFRAHLNASNEKSGGNKYTVNDFILKAVIRAAQAQPAINAAWDGDAIVKFKSVGLSVAIAIDDGLVTPVIKQAEKKTLLEISQSVKDLAGKAKNKKLSPDDFAGGTITVSNLGAFGIDQFAAIINPPQAAIVAIGSIRNAPVVNDKGQIVVGQRMWVGLSGDHRVVDGAVAATFLAEMRKLIESPALMLV